MLFQGVKRRLLGIAEGDDVIRLEHSGELSGNYGRVIAVGAARGGRRHVADKLGAAARAVIGAKVCRLFAPFVFKLRGIPAVAVCLGVRVGLGGFRLLLAHMRLDLGHRIIASAIIAFEPAARADEMQGAGTCRAFIVRYLCGHRIASLIHSKKGRNAPFLYLSGSRSSALGAELSGVLMSALGAEPA